MEQNISVFPHTADCWRDRHYSNKQNIDRLVERLHGKWEDFAQQEAAALNSSLGLNGFPRLSLNGTLAHSLAEYRQGLYQGTGVQGEEPVLLYQLCFQALAEAKGWDKLEDNELLKVLDAEGIPVKEFTSLTGREIKLPEENESDIIRTPAQDKSEGAQPIAGALKQYHFISINNYSAALEQLRTDSAGDRNSLQPSATIGGRNYVRPLTVKEIMQFRLENYNTITNPNGTPRTEAEREQLLTKRFFTCSGIAYSTDGRFKLSREAPQLITMDSIPRATYLSVDYAALNQNNNWQEFVRAQSGVKYNTALTEEEAVNHPMWQFLAEENTPLLRETHQLNCSLYNRSTVMYAWLLDTPRQGQLRALALLNFNNLSILNGSNLLVNNSSFLRVARRSS